MSIKIGSLTIADTYFGSSPISAIYQGSNLIWQRGPVTDDFYVTSDEAFSIKLVQQGTVNAEPQMSSDKSAWMSLVPGAAYDFQAGQKIYIRNIASNDWTVDSSNYLRFSPDCTFKTVGGNMKPLINNSNTMTGSCFRNLFRNNTHIQDAEKLVLPWTTLASYCYQSLFYGCSGLKKAFDRPLPALSTEEYCYAYMFYGCSSLVTIPQDLLPATTIKNAAYLYMFYNCTSLVRACSVNGTGTIEGQSSAQTGGYYGMFYNCYNLETLPRIMPISSESFGSYWAAAWMFSGCSKIKMSQTQTGQYPNAYVIPRGVDYSSFNYMFQNTGGGWAGTPTANTTYYTSNEVI